MPDGPAVVQILTADVLDGIRFLLYLISIVLSAAVAGRLFKAPNRLARMLGVMMVAWMLNSITLLSFLVWWAIVGDIRSPWHTEGMIANAILSAFCPALLYWYLDKTDEGA